MSDSEYREPREDDPGLLESVPGLVRVAASAWWRTAEWTVGGSIRASARVMQAAVSGENPVEVVQSAGSGLREFLREQLGIREEPPEGDEHTASSNGGVPSPVTLRERGAELLRQSADVRFQEDAHPAFMYILENLAPDEGRILRLLALEGPQPSVDVRTARPFGKGDEAVAPGLTMIAEAAGCRQGERVQAYLNNIYRLGLIWFSREPVGDHLRYQVLEAQPDVQEAMGSGRTRTIRRSILLTPFGEDFCETCLPLHTAELDALPGEGKDPPATTGFADKA